MSIRTEIDDVESLADNALFDIKELSLELNKLNDNNELLEISYILSLADSLVTVIQDISEKLY